MPHKYQESLKRELDSNLSSYTVKTMYGCRIVTGHTPINDVAMVSGY